jgi:hypothetical protein
MCWIWHAELNVKSPKSTNAFDHVTGEASTLSVVVSSPLLDVIVREGFEAALLPLGLKPSGRRLTWSKPADELSHLIGLLPTRKRYTIQWSVGCPPAARLLWGDRRCP